MTRYFTQWDDDTIDSTIAGWTHRTAGTAPTYVPKYGTPAVKRRYLQHKPGTTSDLRGLITWDAIDGDANRATFDALTTVKMDDWTGDYAEIWGRVAMSGTTITDGYRVRVIRAGGANNIRVDKRVASVTTTAIGTATVTMSAGKSYYVRFQANGTAIKVRVWDAALGMAGEPTTWDVSITDSGVSAAGYIGLAAVSSSTSHITPFNFFAVGTNGDSAVAPRTNAEFLAWISKPNLRCVLAELPATGYDSGGSPYTKTVRAYVSNIGYTSQQQDSPSLQHYDAYIASIPTFSRQMGADLVGPVSVGFGDLVLKNAASAPRINTAGYAVQCDGVDDYVNVPDSTSLHQGTGSLTYECWVTILSYPPSGKLAGVMAKGTGTGRIWIYLDGTTQKMAFNNYFGGAFDYYVTPAAPSAGRHHVALVVDRDAGMQYAYIDGVQVGSNNVSAAAAVAFDAVSALKFGGTISASTYGNIVVDEARVWNVARNAGQIAKYMNRRAVGNETGLVSAWHFDEGTGTSAVDANTTNANTGTLNGGATWIAGAQLFPWSDDVKGRLDDWLRVSWRRDVVMRMWIGDPSWPRHDFRALMVGRLGQPTAPSMETIKFPIADLMDMLNVPIQSAKFSTGEYADQFHPICWGQTGGGSAHVVSQIEPPLTDAANLIYTLSDKPVLAFDPSATFPRLLVYDNQVEIKTAALTNTNVTGNVLQFSANHGMVVGWLWRSPSSGALPSPLANSTNYWVQSVPALDKITLAATKGGAVITLTTTTLVANASYGYGYTWTIGSPTTVQLVGAPAGRVTVAHVVVDSYAPSFGGVTGGDMLRDIAWRAGIGYNNLGAFNDFTWDSFYWLNTQKHTALEVYNAVLVGNFGWSAFSMDGLLTAAAVGLPSTAVKSFTSANVFAGSIKMIGRIRAVNGSKYQVTYGQWFLTGGPFQTGAQAALQGKSFKPAVTYGAGTIPIDDNPGSIDSNPNYQFDSLHTKTGPDIQTMFKKAIGLFEFRTTLAALWHSNGPVSIGDTISLEHPRLGWKNYTGSDDPSPDNTADYDARNAVVMGIDVNLSNPVDQQVTLKVYRPIPGYYPTANLN